MSLFTWTLPGFNPPQTGLSAQDLAGQVDLLFGADIWFDVSDENGGDTAVTAAGDWAKVQGRECLRQAIIRRIITSPGEWRTLPDYGVGARQFVKERNTPSTRSLLAERIRGQLLRDPRISSVDQINIETLSNMLRISVVVTPKGETQQNTPPLRVSIEVQS